MAPDGMEDVVYQPRDLSLVKGKLGVYIWGNGGCGYDATSARFHLIEIASHGHVAMAPGEIESGPKRPSRRPPLSSQHRDRTGTGLRQTSYSGKDARRSGLDSG